MIEADHKWNTSFLAPVAGLILSVGLTLTAYFIVVTQSLSGGALSGTIFSLAIVQTLIQLFFFLHIGLESKPRWSLMTFLFMVLVLAIIMGGTIWIMHSLNYNLMVTDMH